MILLLPYIEVQAANAMTTPWIVNSAPVMAINMFGHAMGREIGAFPTGVGIIHHASQLLGEWAYGRFYPQQRRGAVFIDKDDYSSKNKHALSLQPTASVHLRLSLVLRFDQAVDGTALQRFMTSARIAGGQVIRHGKPEYFATEAELLARIKTGYWIVERRDLMEAADNPLEALINAIGTRTTEASLPPPEKPEEEDEVGDLDDLDDEDTPEALPSSRSWLAATTLGYGAVTAFEKRHFVREDYPHAFAEPLVGLVQYVPSRRYQGGRIPFWSHQWAAEDVFLITQSTVSN